MKRKGVRIHVKGVVQGVGFRPFVYSLANRLDLTGWVRNTSAGVEIEADGLPDALVTLEKTILSESPPLARITHVEVTPRSPDGFTRFEIILSESIAGAYQPISADTVVCRDCLQELFDPADRRYRYPFINCTNCGPRFTIIDDIPYDRPLTTMAPFDMCSECKAEYENPLDRRFHAQPVACPKCGPQIWIDFPQTTERIEPNKVGREPGGISGENAIQSARRLIQQGKIVAIKGLGGFHLACDATNARAIEELRQRKHRFEKPFAVMMADISSIESHCHVNAEEKILLESAERPIVLLGRRSESPIPTTIAPVQSTLGVMLPYTPLHYLLMEKSPDFPEALVMTSGNISEEPIATENEDAFGRLRVIADAFIMHNRRIRSRCDDSVVQQIPSIETGRNKQPGNGNPRSGQLTYYLRRSRGYVPHPISLPWSTEPILAGGSELKNTFCITRENFAFVSHHIGDLENWETYKAYEEGISHYQNLFRVEPLAYTFDLHPNYMATQYIKERARKESRPLIGVQHHHAHIASCMVDNGLNGEKPVIGIAFDGTGLGDDGAIWGGEILLADYAGYNRIYHLPYVPLPGADKAIREPWRMALAWLYAAGADWDDALPPIDYARRSSSADMDYLKILGRQLENRINSPPTSSIGRLFDAISSLLGIRQTVNFEGQAAMELEALADGNERTAYSMKLSGNTLDPIPMIISIIDDIRAGVDKRVIAARFHNTLTGIVVDACQAIRDSSGVNQVALSGGVWQNIKLFSQTVNSLETVGFDVAFHRQVPANDGGLSLGQAAVAAWKLQH